MEYAPVETGSQWNPSSSGSGAKKWSSHDWTEESGNWWAFAAGDDQWSSWQEQWNEEDDWTDWNVPNTDPEGTSLRENVSWHDNQDEEYLSLSTHADTYGSSELPAGCTMTTKIPPEYNGTGGWFVFEELVQDWEDSCILDKDKRGPALKNRLRGVATVWKKCQIGIS